MFSSGILSMAINSTTQLHTLHLCRLSSRDISQVCLIRVRVERLTSSVQSHKAWTGVSTEWDSGALVTSTYQI